MTAPTYYIDPNDPYVWRPNHMESGPPPQEVYNEVYRRLLSEPTTYHEFQVPEGKTMHSFSDGIRRRFARNGEHVEIATDKKNGILYARMRA